MPWHPKMIFLIFLQIPVKQVLKETGPSCFSPSSGGFSPQVRFPGEKQSGPQLLTTLPLMQLLLVIHMKVIVIAFFFFYPCHPPLLLFF